MAIPEATDKYETTCVGDDYRDEMNDLRNEYVVANCSFIMWKMYFDSHQGDNNCEYCITEQRHAFDLKFFADFFFQIFFFRVHICVINDANLKLFHWSGCNFCFCFGKFEV